MRPLESRDKRSILTHSILVTEPCDHNAECTMTTNRNTYFYYVQEIIHKQHEPRSHKRMTNNSNRLDRLGKRISAESNLEANPFHAVQTLSGPVT